MRFLSLFIFVVSFLASACAQSHHSDTWNDGKGKEKSVEKKRPIESTHWLVKNYKRNKYLWWEVHTEAPDCEVESQGPNAAFYCVQKACENINGEFDPETANCHCPTKNKRDLLVFTPLFGGACLPPKTDNDISYKMGKDPRVFFEFNNEGINYVENVIAENIKYRKEIQSFNIPYLFNESYRFKFINHVKDNEKALLENLESDISRIHYAGVPYEGNQFVEWQYNANQWKIRIDKNIKIGTVKISNRWAKEAAILFLSSSESKSRLKIKTMNPDGCRSHCYLEEWKNFDDGYAVLRKLYIEGQWIHSKVYFTPTQSLENFEVMVTLDSSERPNLVYQMIYEQVSVADTLVTVEVSKVTEQDPFTKIVVSQTDEFSLNNFNHVDYPNYRPSSVSSVAICEWGVSPFRFKDDFPRLIFGPHAHADSDFTGSLWGWQKNSMGNPFDFLTASYPQGDFGYSSPEYSDQASDHHRAVIKSVLISSEQATVTAMNYKNCTSLDSKKNPLLGSEFQGRVVNVSAATGNKGASCEKKLKVLRETKDRLLWVFSAGNDGSYSCEDLLMKEGNAIGVAAISPDSPTYIEYYSRKGRGKVTTAVVRTSMSGTSFAAPVVSAMAADIFASYPHFTPEQVKRSITLGVEFLDLNVDSGGRSELTKALIVASLIDHFPSSSDKKILKLFYKIPEGSSKKTLKREYRQLSRKKEKLQNELSKLKKELKVRQECIEEYDSWWPSKECKIFVKDEIENEKEISRIEKKIAEEELKISSFKKQLGEIESQIKNIEKYEKHSRWI